MKKRLLLVAVIVFVAWANIARPEPTLASTYAGQPIPLTCDTNTYAVVTVPLDGTVRSVRILGVKMDIQGGAVVSGQWQLSTQAGNASPGFKYWQGPGVFYDGYNYSSTGGSGNITMSVNFVQGTVGTAKYVFRKLATYGGVCYSVSQISVEVLYWNNVPPNQTPPPGGGGIATPTPTPTGHPTPTPTPSATPNGTASPPAGYCWNPDYDPNMPGTGALLPCDVLATPSPTPSGVVCEDDGTLNGLTNANRYCMASHDLGALYDPSVCGQQFRIGWSIQNSRSWSCNSKVNRYYVMLSASMPTSLGSRGSGAPSFGGVLYTATHNHTADSTNGYQDSQSSSQGFFVNVSAFADFRYVTIVYEQDTVGGTWWTAGGSDIMPVTSGDGMWQGTGECESGIVAATATPTAGPTSSPTPHPSFPSGTPSATVPPNSNNQNGFDVCDPQYTAADRELCEERPDYSFGPAVVDPSGFEGVVNKLKEKAPFGYVAQVADALGGAAGDAAGGAGPGGGTYGCFTLPYWTSEGTQDADACLPLQDMANDAAPVRPVLLALLVMAVGVGILRWTLSATGGGDG